MASDETSFNIEDEGVFASIFADDQAQDLMTSPYFLPYLSYLCSSDLSKLNSEPDRLQQRKVALLQQTRDLAFHNYKTFISTADCSKGIVSDFSVIEERLQQMLSTLPTLSEHGQNFLKQVGKIGSVRCFTSLTLQRNTELLEILEIPQLMNTCVRNQYYDDALELVFYVKRISKKQQVAEIPVIKSIVDDVKRSSVMMLTQLLAQLRTSLQLPICLKVVGYLRRLECFTETELRFKFLQVRNTWFETKLPQPLTNEEDEDKVYDYLTQLLEAYRVNLFSIVTQYRAIFTDDSSFGGQYSALLEEDEYGEGRSRDSSIFSCWISYRISVFVQILRQHLSKIPTRIDSILGQSMYFGQSFSRVGADFRCLIVGVFTEVMEELVQQDLDEALVMFDTEMMSHTLISSVSYTSKADLPITNTKTPPPPSQLLQHQPLSVYLNALVSVFNRVRGCCPVAMAPWLSQRLSESLNRAADIMIAFHATESAGFSKMEQKTFQALCTAFVDDVIKHVNSCLETLFSQASLAQAYGPNAFVNAKTKARIPRLDVDEVLAKIDKISPKPIIKPVTPRQVTSPQLAGSDDKSVKSKVEEEKEGKLVSQAEEVMAEVSQEISSEALPQSALADKKKEFSLQEDGKQVEQPGMVDVKNKEGGIQAEQGAAEIGKTAELNDQLSEEKDERKSESSDNKESAQHEPAITSDLKVPESEPELAQLNVSEFDKSQQIDNKEQIIASTDETAFKTES